MDGEREGEASAGLAAARSPPRLRASLDRVVLMHPATKLSGSCGAEFRAFFGARKSCVLMRDDANRCVVARSCDPAQLLVKMCDFYAGMHGAAMRPATSGPEGDMAAARAEPLNVRRV